MKFSTWLNGLTADASPNGATDYVVTYDADAATSKKVLLENIPAGSGTDADAVHDNVSGEIDAVAEKTAPVAADLLLIEDSAASNAKKKVQVGNLPYHAFSGCALTKSGAQSVNTATETPITFDGEVYDTDTYHDNVTNNTRLTAPVTGYYMVGCSVELEALADEKYMILRIRKGGASANGDGRARIYASGAVTASYPGAAFSRPVQLNAGEYVELTAEHNHGSARNVRETTNGTSFWIYRIG